MMERLTEKWNNKYIRIKGCRTLYTDEERKGAYLNNAVARLAAYEDTGLEPEEIDAVAALASKNCSQTADAINAFLAGDAEIQALHASGLAPDGLSRAAELLAADKEGRCVVLPCKEDERWKDKHGTVYTIEGFHCDRWAGWSVLFRAENEEEDGDDLKAVNFAYFECNFTRAEAEAVLEAQHG